MLKKHEVAGTTDSEEYQAGIQKFNEKHVCRVQPWPQDLVDAFEALEADPTVYATMYAFYLAFLFSRLADRYILGLGRPSSTSPAP
jgi:L-proline amide hydrolase